MRAGVLPWCLQNVIIALLPKDEGERPIGLLPIVVRILDRLFYGAVAAWCDSAHGFGTVPSPIAVPYVPPSTQALSWRQHTLWESVMAFF